MIVAIDGPAGSGKSTVARLLAREKGFTYLDTGAMYRAVALRALEEGVLDDVDAVVRIARTEAVSFGRDADGGQTVLIDGRDVTSEIRLPRVDAVVSSVAGIPDVRSVMVARQRLLAGSSDAVAEGRDIGTVVFPDAEVKVFLTASPRARAHRRTEQNRARAQGDGTQMSEDEVLAQIVRRDEADSSRSCAPLRAAEDAVEIDSSVLTVEEVLRAVEGLIDAVRGRDPREASHE